MRSSLIAGVMLLGACASAQEATEPAAAPGSQTRFATVEGARVAYWLGGEGRPAVVFEAGFGGTHESWEVVAPRVAERTTTFTYDRPGRGESAPTVDDADGVRTSEEAARTLRRALDAANLAPPYLLVGWSLGGLYVQKFAQLYPNDVAGIVLVDNRPATYIGERHAAGVRLCQGDAVVNLEWSPATQATFRGIAPSEAAAPTPEQLGNIPIVVITATSTVMSGDEDFAAGFREAQTRFAARLRNGRQVIAVGASHDNVGADHADVVINEVLRLVEAEHGKGR